MNNFKKVQCLLQKNVVNNETTKNVESKEPIGNNETTSATSKIVNEKNKGRNTKDKFVDDGRSITDLNIEGFSWYIPKRWKNEKNELADLKISKEERKAMILGAFSAILPVAGFVVLMYAGAFLLISMWLK